MKTLALALAAIAATSAEGKQSSGSGKKTSLRKGLRAGSPFRDSAFLGGGSCTGTTYDYFLLETQWDITECMDVFSCNSSNQFFTMHGLWPNDNDGNFPCFCTDEPFNPSSITSIQNDMNTYWPSLNGPSSSFWDHEWSKHGTCAEDVFSDQLAYFSGALNLRSKYDIVAALTTAGFPPSNNNGFSLSQFKAALQTAYGAGAAVTCDSSGNIESVAQCISKSLQPMECPSNVQDSCSAGTLYLPSSQSR